MIANSAIGEMLQQSEITVRKNVRHSERVIYVDARKVRAYTLLVSITKVWKQNSSMYVSTRVNQSNSELLKNFVLFCKATRCKSQVAVSAQIAPKTTLNVPMSKVPR